MIEWGVTDQGVEWGCDWDRAHSAFLPPRPFLLVVQQPTAEIGHLLIDHVHTSDRYPVRWGMDCPWERGTGPWDASHVTPAFVGSAAEGEALRQLASVADPIQEAFFSLYNRGRFL